MDTNTALSQAETLLQPFSGGFTRAEDNRLDVVMEPGKLKQAVSALFKAHWGYLGAITGLDVVPPANPDGTPGAGAHFEVLYTFFEGAAVANMRVSLSYDKPVLPTICDIIPSATLYERELMELFGVTIDGTPSLDRLILSDDWPEGVYPLRKSFTGLDSQQA
ncbi:MAG: NADH-quinone oxidoreductase subunit C [Anaerolineaceae bacterium]|nr:NADH-quinone oxidoreductase subunit C [Anaerolineaceae bacterium]